MMFSKASSHPTGRNAQGSNARRAAPAPPRARGAAGDAVTYRFSDGGAAVTVAIADSGAAAAAAQQPTATVRAPPPPPGMAAATAVARAAAAAAQQQPGAAAPPPPPAPAAAPVVAAGAVPTVDIPAIKLALLERVAGLNRGALATDADRAAVDDLVRALEASRWRAPNAPPASLEGRWELLYASTEAFRNSPFFGAFSNVVTGFVGDATGPALADAIFAFTDKIPGAEIGSAFQTIDLSASTLVSEVDLAVFPGLRGTVVTTSRLLAAPNPGVGPIRLPMAVESTCVERSTFSPLGLDSVAVPVEQLIEAVRGSEAAHIDYEVTFLDANMRVTRCGRQTLIHRRS